MRIVASAVQEGRDLPKTLPIVEMGSAQTGSATQK